MDVPSATLADRASGWTFDDAGVDALLFDLELITVLLFGPVRAVERDRAA